MQREKNNDQQMNQQQMTYQFIARYLSAECSQSEREYVDAWRKSSPDAEKLYHDLAQTWELSRATAPTIYPNKEQVWANISQQIRTSEKGIYTRRTLIRISAIAASVALLIGIATSLVVSSYLGRAKATYGNTVFTAPEGQKSRVCLPDSTIVWLNSGSQLTYTQDFNLKTREVYLQGEAFFDVKRSKSVKQFVVKTQKVDILVHGTAFDVSAYERDSQMFVALERGSVELLNAQNGEQITMLTPGQKAEVDISSGAYYVSDFDKEVNNVWIYGRIVFKEVTAAEMFERMERWYGVEIRLDNRPSDAKYWFTIQTESLTEMLQLINKITPINYTINGEEVHVRYK